MGTSTLDGLHGLDTARRGRLIRRGGLVVGLLLLGVSFLGVYGPSERTITTTSGTDRLTLTYGSVVRSGESVPLQIRLQRDGGFAGPVTVVFEREVFDRFDFQNWYPNPAAEVGEGPLVSYEFDPPDGDVLTVSLDARVAPTQWGGRDTYALWLDQGGIPALRTDYTVWVVP